MPVMATTCPLCKSTSRRVFEQHDIWIADCGGCKHRFADFEPSPEQLDEIYGDNYFEGGGAGYKNYLEEERLLRAAGRRYARLVSKFAEPGTVLDVGSAAGFILMGFQDEGWTGSGIELNKGMAEYARRELKLDVFSGPFEAFQHDVQFDLVTMIQVISHFQDPMAAIAQAAALTKSGGLLLIETWRRDSLTAKAFGRNWHEYSPPSVLHWFTKKGLQAAVENAGLTAIASGRPAKWINAGHAKSLVKYKLEQLPAGNLFANGLRLIPDKLTLPYPAEDLAWLLFRKS